MRVLTGSSAGNIEERRDKTEEKAGSGGKGIQSGGQMIRRIGGLKTPFARMGKILQGFKQAKQNIYCVKKT